MTLINILSRPFVLALLTRGSKTAINAILGSRIVQNTAIPLLPGCPSSTLNDIQLCGLASFDESVDLVFFDIDFGAGLERIQGLGSFRIDDLSYTPEAGEAFVRGDNSLSVSLTVISDDDVSATLNANGPGFDEDFSLGVGSVKATVGATLSVDCDVKGVILNIDTVQLDNVDWFDARSLADDICFGAGICRDAIDGPLDDINDLITDALNGAVGLIIEGIFPDNAKILPLLICPN